MPQSIPLRVDDGLRAALERLAAASDRTLSAYIRLVLREHVAISSPSSDMTTAKEGNRCR